MAQQADAGQAQHEAEQAPDPLDLAWGFLGDAKAGEVWQNMLGRDLVDGAQLSSWIDACGHLLPGMKAGHEEAAKAVWRWLVAQGARFGVDAKTLALQLQPAKEPASEPDPVERAAAVKEAARRERRHAEDDYLARERASSEDYIPE